MDTFRKWLNKPKADDKSLLARFYHADRALTAISNELDSFDGRAEPDRCSRLVSRLRQGQDKVLSITNRIMEELLGDDRAQRTFRAKFPEEVLQENLAGQLWFGAECLAAGSSIINREFESTAIRPLAQAVTKSLENVRNLLRDQCLRNNIPNSATLKLDINDSATEQLYESLKIFDRLFAEFEFSYVSAMVQVKTKQEYEMQELICVLFSETLQRALQIHLVEQDQVDAFDPALMFSIPRLAIITGLVVYHKGPLNMEMPADQLSEMFRPFRTILIKIRDLLRSLNKNELYQLEKLLCTNEEIHLKNINNNSSNNNNNNYNSSPNNSQSDRQNLQSTNNASFTKNEMKNIRDDNLTVMERRNSILSEQLQQQREKELKSDSDREPINKNEVNILTDENLNVNDCDLDSSQRSNNVLVNNNQPPINDTTTSETINNQVKHNNISDSKNKQICKTQIKTERSNSRRTSSSKLKKRDRHNCAFICTSPTNSISSASSSATTADISSDWTDDEDENDEDKIKKENLTEVNEFMNDTNTNLVTADCTTGFLIPNTNLGNLFQQNDDPLTDNIVASEDEYGGNVGDCGTSNSNDTVRENTLSDVIIEAVTSISSDIATLSTDNIRNNNFVTDYSNHTADNELKSNLNCEKSSPKQNLFIAEENFPVIPSVVESVAQPSCSRMDITDDSSDESEISKTITKKAQQQSSSTASSSSTSPTSSSTTNTTANSNLNSRKCSCDSISKTSKKPSVDGGSVGDNDLASAENKTDNKSEKHSRYHHHHHHHHHNHHHNNQGHRSCHHHKRNGINSQTISSSNSSSMTTTTANQSVHLSKNCNREYRHHSKKQRFKHQHSTNNSRNNMKQGVSSEDTTSSLSDGDPHEVDLALRAASRMKFKSTENLLHRLFVCIAGVADQLQTNFASDLRQILRSVFLMNTTPVQEEIKIPDKTKPISADLFEFRPSENDVIQENNGGSNQSIYSAAEEVNPESDNVFMNDSSPNQSLNSGSSDNSSNQLNQQEVKQQQQKHNTNRHTERGSSLDSVNTVVQSSHHRKNVSECNGKNNNPRSIMERTRSLGGNEEQEEEHNKKLHLLQERSRRPLSGGSVSAESSESPTTSSSASNSPINERSQRSIGGAVGGGNQNEEINFQVNNLTSAISSAGTSSETDKYLNQQPPSSAPINVVRPSNHRRSSGSHILSQSVTNRRSFNSNSNNNTNNNYNTSTSLPKPSPPAWIPDEDAPRCMACTIPFTAFRRRHHCRNCGRVFCGGCSNASAPLPKYGLKKAVRVCRECYVREVGT